MNASEKAASLGFVSKIATIVNLFQAKFTGAIVDLTPWLDDPMTRATLDPDSIDLGFHFPRIGRTNSRHTLLLQIRLQPEWGKTDKVVGLEISSHSSCGCLWEFSTVGNWQFVGTTGLSPEYQAQIKSFCQDVLGVFNNAEYSCRHQNKRSIESHYVQIPNSTRHGSRNTVFIDRLAHTLILGMLLSISNIYWLMLIQSGYSR